MQIIIMILLLSFLILVHEAGHFMAARMLGIKVDKFGNEMSGNRSFDGMIFHGIPPGMKNGKALLKPPQPVAALTTIHIRNSLWF